MAINYTVPSLNVPRLQVPTIQVPKLEVPKLQVPSFRRPYNYPRLKNKTRHVVDLGDVLFGGPQGTEQLQQTLLDNRQYFLNAVPVLNKLAGAYYLIKERTVDPIVQGNVKLAMINSLESIGQTMDVLANPVKSLMPWAGGGTPDDFLKSMGWLEGAYRETYQWNTGSGIVNFVGEVISDPLNWLDWGTSSLLKSTANTTSDTLTKNLANVVGDDIVKDVTKSQIRNVIEYTGENLAKAGKAIADPDTKLVKDLLDKVDVKLGQLKDELQHVTKGSKEYNEIKRLIKQYNSLNNINTADKLQQIISDLRLSEGYKHYQAIRNTVKPLRQIESTIQNAAWIINPLLGVPLLTIKYGKDAIYTAVHNYTVKRLKDVNINIVNKNPNKFAQKIKREIITRLRSAHKSEWEVLDTFLREHNITDEDLYNARLSMIRSIDPKRRFDVDYMDRMFKTYLFENIPRLKEVAKYKSINEALDVLVHKTDNLLEQIPFLDNEISVNDFINRIVDDVAVGAEEIDSANQTLIRLQQMSFDDQVETFFTKTTDDAYYPPVIKRLAFIKSVVFGGERMTKNKVVELLTKANTKSGQDYMELVQLLNIMGITPDNVKTVDDLLMLFAKDTERNKNKVLKKLNKILKDGASGEFMHTTPLPKIKNTVTKSFKKDVSVILDELTSRDTDAVEKVISKTKTDSAAKQTLLDKLRDDLSESKAVYTLNKLKDLSISNADVLLDKDLIKYELSSIFKTEEDIALLNLIDIIFDSEDYTELSNLDFDMLDRDFRFYNQLIKQDFKYNKLNISESTKQFFNSLYDFFNNDTNRNELLGFKNMLNNYKTYYSFISNKASMFTITLDNIISNPKLHRLWNDLIIRGDDSAKSLKVLLNCAEILEASGLSDDAERIKLIITNINSAQNLLENVLGRRYNISYALNEKTVENLSYLLFNQLFDSDIAYSTDLLNIPEFKQQFLDEFMSRFINSQERYILKENPELVDLYNVFDLKLKSVEELTLEEVELLKRSRTISDLYDEIRDETTIILDYFLTSQASIERTINSKAHSTLIHNPFNDKFIAELTELSYRYDEIITALKGKVNTNELNAFTKIFLMLPGKEITVTTDQLQTILELDFIRTASTLKNGAEIVESELSKVTKDATQDSLARAITDSFTMIKKVNDELGDRIDLPVHYLDKNGNWAKKVTASQRYILYDEFNSLIQNYLHFNNAFDFNAMNFKYSVKKLSKPLAGQLNKFVNPSDADWFILNAMLDNNISLLTNNLDKAVTKLPDGTWEINKAFINRVGTRSVDELNTMRTALVTFFKNSPTITWRPIDPETYFKDMDPITLEAWHQLLYNSDMITKRQRAIYHEFFRKNTILENLKYSTYSIDEKIDYYSNPYNITYMMEHADREGISEVDAFDNWTNRVNKNTIRAQNSVINKNLSKYIKDPDALQQYKDNFIIYIQNDINALNNTKILEPLLKSKKKVGTLIKDTRVLNELQRFGITADTELSSDKVLRYIKHNMEVSLEESIRGFNAAQLRTYIDKNTDGILILTGTGISPLLNDKNLAEVGLMRKVEDGFTLIRRTTNDEFKAVPLEYVYHETPFKQIEQTLMQLKEDNNAYYNWGDIDLPLQLFTGDMMNDEVLEDFVTKHQDFFGDALVQKTYRNLSVDGINNFYLSSVARPQLAIVGSNGFNKVIDSLNLDRNTSKFNPKYKSSDAVQSLFTGTVNAIKRQNNKNKYYQLIFNDEFSLSADWIERIFKDASDKQIKDIFARNNFEACVLKEGIDGKPKVMTLSIIDRKSLEAAKKAKAVLLPYEVYRNAVLVINKNVDVSKLVTVYKNVIVGTYKTMYLSTPGFIFRNGLDTLIMKNLAATEGFNGVIDNFRYEYKAAKDLSWYDTVNQKIIEEANGKPINVTHVRKVVSQLPTDEQNLFVLLYEFENTGAGSGRTESVETYLRNLSIAEKPSENTFVRKWSEALSNTPGVKQILTVNDNIERIGRLGLFYNLIDNGTDNADAIRKVIETHFDYTTKGTMSELLEQIFWFSTFPINNVLFYVNEGLTKNPDILRAQLAAMRLSYNNEDITWEDVKHSKYLTYNALAGNLIVKVGDKNVVIKTGSSVFDFFNILMNPIGEAAERLNPFISVLTGQSDISELSPFTSQVNHAKQIAARLQGDTQKSLVPSIYGVLYNNNKNYKTYPKYYSYNYNRSRWRVKRKKIYPHVSNVASHYVYLYKSGASWKKRRYALKTGVFAYNPAYARNSFKFYRSYRRNRIKHNYPRGYTRH